MSAKTPHLDSAMHVGAVASLKHGMEHFVYRELSFFEERGASISVFPTKYKKGLYEPRPSWGFHPWNAITMLLAQFAAFFASPVKYWQLLRFAAAHGAVVDFVLAMNFVRNMHNVDLIYATFGDRKLFVGYFCKQWLNKPLVCTIHAYEIYENPNPRMFEVAIATCDQINTVTQYNREQLKARFNIPEDRVNVIRLSIDLEEFQPSKKFVVLIVGYFVQKKGHTILLEALRQLNNPDIELWVVGTGRDSNDNVDLKTIATQMGLDSKVAFFDGLSGTALRAVYHACDVFCLPSHFDEFGCGEGFPTVIIEAMACGKPVISTKHVEIPAILEQIVVDEKDVSGLADAIHQVYQSSDLRDQLGRRNREIAVQEFSTANVDQALEAMARQCGRSLNDPAPSSEQSAKESQHECV